MLMEKEDEFSIIMMMNKLQGRGNFAFLKEESHWNILKE